MKNIEKYKDEILNSSRADLTCCVNDSILGKNCYRTCNECKKHAMQWLLSEAEEPILDEVEREYLSYGIRQFREKIECIYKHQMSYIDEYYIAVRLKDGYSLRYPRFKGNTMYKGMEVEKEYTLEELGL